MYKENGRFEENEIIQDNANTDSFENVIIEDVTINNTNYLSIGIFSISAIFLTLTIIFSIFLAKHTTKCKEKSI